MVLADAGQGRPLHVLCTITDAVYAGRLWALAHCRLGPQSPHAGPEPRSIVSITACQLR